MAQSALSAPKGTKEGRGAGVLAELGVEDLDGVVDAESVVEEVDEADDASAHRAAPSEAPTLAPPLGSPVGGLHPLVDQGGPLARS